MIGPRPLSLQNVHDRPEYILWRDPVHAVECSDRAFIAAVNAAGPAGQSHCLMNPVVLSGGCKTKLGNGRSKDCNHRCSHCHSCVHRSAVVGHEDSRSPDGFGRLENGKLSRGVQDICLFASMRDTITQRSVTTASHEDNVLSRVSQKLCQPPKILRGPPLRFPDGSGSNCYQVVRLNCRSELFCKQLINSLPILARRIEQGKFERGLDS